MSFSKRISKLICGIVSTLAVAVLMLGYNEVKVFADGSYGLNNPVHNHDLSNSAADNTTWSYVYFGAYPSGYVTDTATIEQIEAALAAEKKTDGDVWVGCDRYTKENINQYNNYSQETNYKYFKWEKIKWRVVKVEDDKAFLLADKAVESRPFITGAGSRVYWGNSTIRSWLNGYSASSNLRNTDYTYDGFINRAFNDYERAAILVTQVEASDLITPLGINNGGPTTNDKVFLMSSEELKNTYLGFCQAAQKTNCRLMTMTDFAKAYSKSNYTSADKTNWFMRTPGYEYDSDKNNTENNGSAYCGFVSVTGSVNSYGYLGNQNMGIVPALTLDLTKTEAYSLTTTPSLSAHVHEFPTRGVNGKLPTCTENGREAIFKCKVTGCRYYKGGEAISPRGHVYTNPKTGVEIIVSVEKPATCTEKGKTTVKKCLYCEVTCGGEDIAATGHAWNASAVITKPATVAETGIKTFTCSKCTQTKTEVIPKLPAPAAGTVISSPTGESYTVIKPAASGAEVEYSVPQTGAMGDITIPNTIISGGVEYKVTSIAAKAFKNNTKIKSVKLENNIIQIGAEAFYGCKNLKKVTLNTALKKIGDKAFYKCTSLTSIKIPKNVSKIGKSAFEKCTKLKTVIISTKLLSKSKVGAAAFKSINSSAVIKVPASKLTVYKAMLKSRGVTGAKQKIKKA